MVDARRLVARFLLAGASAAGLAVGVAVQATPAGATIATRHQRLDPLQGRPGHHPRLVGPLRLDLDRFQPDTGRERRCRAGLGQPDRHHGAGHHLHPRDRWHLVCQGQHRRPREPGRTQLIPSCRGRRPVDRSSRPTTRPSRRSSKGCAPPTLRRSWPSRPRSPWARRAHSNGESVDAIDGTQKFGKKSQHVVLYVRARGTHVPVEEDSVEFQGTAHGRRAHHLLEVGRAGAARGAHRDHLGRLNKRRLRKSPDDDGPCPGRGKMAPFTTPGQVGAPCATVPGLRGE